MDYNILLLGTISIVGLGEWLKQFDSKNKLKKFYNLIPLILAIPVGILIMKYNGDPWYMAFLYWSVETSMSVLGYTAVLESIQTMLEK